MAWDDDAMAQVIVGTSRRNKMIVHRNQLFRFDRRSVTPNGVVVDTWHCVEPSCRMRLSVSEQIMRYLVIIYFVIVIFIIIIIIRFTVSSDAALSTAAVGASHSETAGHSHASNAGTFLNGQEYVPGHVLYALKSSFMDTPPCTPPATTAATSAASAASSSSSSSSSFSSASTTPCGKAAPVLKQLLLTGKLDVFPLDSRSCFIDLYLTLILSVDN